MGSIIAGREAHGSIINGQVQFEGEGWFPLKLADNINGNVLAKLDRNNSQVLLQGGIVTTTTTDSANGHFILIPATDEFRFNTQGVYVGTGTATVANISSVNMYEILGSDSDGNLWMNGSFPSGCSLIFRGGWNSFNNMDMGPVKLPVILK